MADLGNEIEFKKDGIMSKRANEVLNKACNMLSQIKEEGLFKTLEQGKFAGVKRPMNGGKGLNGVIEKGTDYYNPFIDMMLKGERV